MFLVFGGSKDFNINALKRQLELDPVASKVLQLEEDNVPNILWDLVSDRLIIDKEICAPSAIFLRNDVFNSIPSNKAVSFTWYKTLKEWAYAHEEVLIFNKGYRGMHKSYNLCMAKKVGFDTPYTLITNQINVLQQLKNPAHFITKPVNGGKYTQSLDHFLEETQKSNASHQPLMYLQNKLIQPEMRIFGIGDQFFAFLVQSSHLDYRTDTKTKVIEVEVPPALSEKLIVLMNILQLDFGAADFKTCPQSGKYLFLEINSGPMFAKFDRAANGKIAQAIIDWHTKARN